MKKLLLSIEKEFCSDCSLALARFIGNMDGVASVGVEDSDIAIVFDDSKIASEMLQDIARENIRKFGYMLLNSDTSDIRK